MAAPRRSLHPSAPVLRRALLAIACALIVAMDWSPASAQGFGWFGGLFGGGPRRPSYGDGAPPYPGYGYDDGYGRRYRQRAYGEQDDDYYAPRRRAPRRRQADQPADSGAAKSKQAAKPAKAPTVFVDVFGDGLGQQLANGLDDSMADLDSVGIVHKGKGSSGLANAGFYDWPKAIDEMLGHEKAAKAETKDKGESKAAKTEPKAGSKDARPEKSQDPKDADATDDAKREKIDVAVMMIGSNDRQPITEDGKTYQPGSSEWAAIYRRRVMAIDEAFAKRKIPLVWVGVPITKDDDFADAMAKLNEIYREAAAATGATFVDTWEPFSDADGDFAAFGPDVNGQTVRLRSGDGIYFTKAGARKLAHFVEAHVRHDLEGRTPLPQLPTAAAPAPDTKDGKAKTVLVKPEAGPIRDLGEAPRARDGKLVDLHELASRDADAAKSKAHDEAAMPPVGRADNFRWTPPDGPKPAAAKPAAAQVDASKPDAAKVDAAKPDAAKAPPVPAKAPASRAETDRPKP